MKDVRSILYRYAQPNRKYSCYKYKETKQQTEKRREPPAIELITPVIVTAKTKNICMLKIQIQRTKKGQIKETSEVLTRYPEQKINKLKQSQIILTKQYENTRTN